jgi:TP901 family phage tail tape measure protein
MAGLAGANIGAVQAVLKLNTSQFEKASSRAISGFKKGISGMVRFTERWLKRGAIALSVYATLSVRTFAKFQDAIVRSAAVTTGAIGQMRDAMEKSALEMSKRTILSAQELAEGYFALGQAGFTAAQSIKALPVVTEFAIASQVKLDTATRYLVRTLEGLGMASANATQNMLQMERVSNAFTFAAIKTTAEIRDFAVAMTHAAAPALRLVNKSMEEGTAVLMAFARAGIVGEEAGTLLWTTVRDLQRASIKARGEWRELGLTIYDTQGKMRNLADIFSDLEEKFADMSDEGKKVSLMLLGFQDRSLRGIQALMGFSKQMRQFQKDMEIASVLTSDLAEKYMESFMSQMKMLWHHVVDVSIAVGDKLAPAIWEFSQLLERSQETIKKWAVFLADKVATVITTLRHLSSYMMTDWRSAITTSLLLVQEVFAATGKSILMIMEETFRVLIVNIGPMFKRITARTREFHKMVSAELFRRFSPFQLAELKSDYPKQYDILLKQIEDQVRKKLDSANFQKKFNEQHPLQPFTIDKEGFENIWGEAVKEMKRIMSESGIYDFIKGEKQRDVWRSYGLMMKDILVSPWKGAGKLIAIEVSKLWVAGETQLGHAARVEVAMKKLKQPLRAVHDEIKAQKDMIGKTNNELAKYRLRFSLIKTMEEEFGAFRDWVPAELEAFNKELAEQIRLFDAILGKRKDFDRFFDASRQWAEDASYLWENLGEDLSRGLDNFADTFTEMLSTGSANWKQFLAGLLKDWLNFSRFR